jgi:hypothetical protein
MLGAGVKRPGIIRDFRIAGKQLRRAPRPAGNALPDAN